MPCHYFIVCKQEERERGASLTFVAAQCICSTVHRINVTCVTIHKKPKSRCRFRLPHVTDGALCRRFKFGGVPSEMIPLFRCDSNLLVTWWQKVSSKIEVPRGTSILLLSLYIRSYNHSKLPAINSFIRLKLPPSYQQVRVAAE